MASLRDTTVVITGASSGMGLATAHAFARLGANIVLAARRTGLLDLAARECESLGGRALAVTADVTDPAQMRGLAGAAAEAFGRIDIWINNAGMSLWGPFEEIPLESQARLVEVNLLGAINGTHAVLPHFFAHGGRGILINNISIGGKVPMPWATTYTATKFGLAGFTEALRDELSAHSDIRVCGVYPPFVDTPTNLHSPNYTGRALRPVPPVVTPERVAEVMVELAFRPRRSVRIGAQHALAVPYAVAPDRTGRLVARLGERFLLRSGPRAPASPGSLFEPVMDGRRTRGGWGEPERARARRTLAVLALAGMAGLGAAALARPGR
ncbi:SDR family oxidoreductase [Skermanella rosea]|uniref:SDR family oxidoreductase n=1 Tax=Skermanella rosea TaxID=1817965 RepID=UPI0019320ABF|nr:SDR family oxidoreductase [Skermanella rosea]UEM02834.1 SDR family oxidoreductase [Skermanella rosea]